MVRVTNTNRSEALARFTCSETLMQVASCLGATTRITSMSDYGSSPPEEAHDRATRAFDPYRNEPPIGDRWLETVRQTTLKAPLECLAVAFLLGILVARRR